MVKFLVGLDVPVATQVRGQILRGEIGSSLAVTFSRIIYVTAIDAIPRTTYEGSSLAVRGLGCGRSRGPESGAGSLSR